MFRYQALIFLVTFLSYLPLFSETQSVFSYDGRIEIKLNEGWEKMTTPSPEVSVFANKTTREGFNLLIVPSSDAEDILKIDFKPGIKLELKDGQEILKEYLFKNQQGISIKAFKISDGHGGKIFIHFFLFQEDGIIYRMIGTLTNNQQYKEKVKHILESIHKVSPSSMKDRAENGSHLDQFNYAQYLLKNVGFDQALIWFKKSAENGSSNAMIRVGNYYQHGVEGYLIRDFDKAESWYSKAIKLNDPNAYWNIAWSYHSEFFGKGPEKQKYAVKKFKYLEMASNLGHKKAQRDLVNSYLEGEGVKKDPLKAKELLFLFAENGNEIIQFNLSRLYLDKSLNENIRKELGIKLDSSIGYKWLKKAAENRHPMASRIINNLNKQK